MSKALSSDTPDAEALIRLAYGLVAGPEGYEALFDALEAHQADEMEAAFSNQDIAQTERLTEVETHFENALSMLRSQGRRKLSASSAIRTLNASTKPALTLSNSGQILHANPAAQNFFDLPTPFKLDGDQFEPGHYDQLLVHLKGLESQPENTVIAIFGIYSSVDDSLIKMALSRTTGWQGQPVGLLSALHISWYPDIGQRFRDMMGLTTAELQITRAIVTGLPLAAVAEQRGSKLSTVRNQTKSLLKKLSVRSQTELACLYSGFSRFSLESGADDPGAQRRSAPETLVAIKRGHVIDYTMAGAMRGKPVLYLPSMLGGRVVTGALQNALIRHDIKLVMPWRPGFSKSYNTQPADDLFQDTVSEVRTLLDTLSIDRLPVIGQMTSTMHAFAAAHYLPDRISGLMAITPGLPTVRGPHLKHIGQAQKLRSLLTREAPRVGRLIAHAFLLRVDAGYDVEFIRHYLKDSQADLEFTRRAETIETFRDAYDDTHAQGYDGFIEELTLFGSDWHALTEGLSCPVQFIVGEEETAFPPDAIEAFAQTAPAAKVTRVAVAGHLVAYEQPDLWVSRLADMIGSAPTSRSRSS